LIRRMLIDLVEEPVTEGRELIVQGYLSTKRGLSV